MLKYILYYIHKFTGTSEAFSNLINDLFSSKTAAWLSKVNPDCVHSGRTLSQFLTSLCFYFLNL